MEERNELILLFDYYKDLLSDIQIKYFEEYYFNNLSLGEIADIYNVSRNAVHKQIKTSIDKLKFYEEKLKVIDKHNKILKEIDNIDEKTKEKITKIIES